jgi:hypothetical protein
MRLFTVVLVANILALAYALMMDIPRTLTPCEIACDGGACRYENCDEAPNCSGGNCLYYRSKGASCTGGACIFDECYSATCDGGSCTFYNPPETLKDGYCNGESCDINGTPHPVFKEYLSV